MKKRKRAFTLIEVLVTAGVMAMVLLVVFYFYKYGRVTWSSEQSKLDILQDVRTTFNIVQRDLREAIIIPSSPSNPTGYELKEFTPQKLTFSRYARYQGLKTQDVTYEISIIGKKAKLTRKTSDSLKEEVLLTIKTSEGTRGRVDYGLLAYNP
jgi:prepilin-type N-terminal cleavage/methylation domain-containing protein